MGGACVQRSWVRRQRRLSVRCRVLQGLSRLQLPQPWILHASVACTIGTLVDASPQAVAGLVVGLVQHQQLCQPAPDPPSPSQPYEQQTDSWRGPPAPFIQELCIVSFNSMSQYSAQVRWTHPQTLNPAAKPSHTCVV